jgi:hypothetical protein
MAKRPVRNNQFTTEEPVVKEEPKHILAEETAEQTEAVVSEESEQKEPKAEAVAEEAHEELEGNDAEPVEEPKAQTTVQQPSPKAKMVRVTCDQLYLRPEPNKVGTPLGILEKGNQLTLVENDAKLPLGWIEVATIPVGTRGYVMKEFVEYI